jgi:CPA2 family monovalent cation:H+ antiporter-2
LTVFDTGSLDAGALLGLGVVLAAVGAGARLAAGRGMDPFPVPVVVGLLISALTPLHALRPGAEITRAGAGIAVVLLLFCAGLDHGGADRRAAAATISVGVVAAADAALNFVPGALFGLLAGFGPTGAVLLGGSTWASSWAVATGTLDRRGGYGNRENPAPLAVLVLEHAAAAVYLPLAASLLATGGTASRLTALLGSAAAAIAAVAWLTVGPPPAGPPPAGPRGLFVRASAVLRESLSARPGPGVSLGLLLAGTALVLAGGAAALGVAAAGIAYLGGAVLASSEGAGIHLSRLRPAAGALRDLSAVATGLGLGLLIPGSRLPGALAGGLILAAVTAATKVVTGWWAAGRLRTPGRSDTVGRGGRLRAGVILVPRGELAVALGVLVALAAPGGGPGTGLAALIAAEVVLTGVAASAVSDAGRAGWYRWAVPTPAAARPEPSGAG